MKRSFADKTESIIQRQNPDGVRIVLANESMGVPTFDEAPRDELHDFIWHAMCEVPQIYTDRVIRNGELVKNTLNKVLPSRDLVYQGSVMTGTHIKGASDIDLLCLGTPSAHSTDPRVGWLLNMPTYRPAQDRDKCVTALCNAGFYTVLQHAKSIQVYTSRTATKVDVVNGTWQTNDRHQENRKVSIYNHAKSAMEPGDYPFNSIKKINDRSSFTNGRLKRMIRFLKNLRTESDLGITVSSFELNAICYAIDPSIYVRADYIGLVDVLTRYIYHHVIITGAHPEKIPSVTGLEYPFRKNPAALMELQRLYTNELFPIWDVLHKHGEF